MEPLDPQLRQLIDEGLPAAMPDEHAQERGLAAFVAHVEGSPPPIPPAAGAGSGLTKLLVGVATLGAVTTGGWAATRTPSEPSRPVVREPAPSAEPAPLAEGSMEETPSPAVPAPSSQPPPPPVLPTPTASATARPRNRRASTPTEAAKPSVADQLKAEATLIAKAESALDRGKPREALALCDFHREGFDAPQLTTERTAIAAMAACMVDETDTAAGEAFVRAHPKSALAKRVRQRCGLTSTPSNSTSP